MDNNNSDPEVDDSDRIHRIYNIISSHFNLNLFKNANEELKEINPYFLSINVFHTGIVVLLLWSLLLFIGYLISQITSSNSIFGMVSTAVQLGPTLPIFLIIFAYMANWSFNRLQSTSPPNMTQGILVRKISLGTASFVALVLAGAWRRATIQVVTQSFGESPTPTEMMAIMIVDMGYLALVLIGLGGLCSIIFEPKNE